MAHAFLSHLVAQNPRNSRLRARQARALRPVRPSHVAEVWYRGELLAIVGLLRKVGADIANELRPHWPATHDAMPGSASETFRRAAARFGNIKNVADRLAALAARLNLGQVDARLKAAIKASVSVDIGPVLTDHGPIQSAMAEATRANAELITSIPEQYLERVREVVTEAFASGQRWETVVEAIQHIGDVTESRAKLIARDQTNKLTSDFARVRQVGLGIERYTWSGARDARERKSHLDMEGTTQRWDAPPEVDGENVHPGQAINCFPGDSEIQFAGHVTGAFRRRYAGVLAEIVTASGRTLRATPNHPVLTLGGWKPIGSLDESDHVIEVADQIGHVGEVHQDQGVPTIAEVFAAAAKDRIAQPIGMSRTDFHGDGSDGQVDVVFAARPLFVNMLTPCAKGRGDLALALSDDAGSGHGPLELAFLIVRNAAHGIMRRLRERLALLWAGAAHSQRLCFADAAPVDSSLVQPSLDDNSFEPHAARDRQLAFASDVGGHDRCDIDAQSVRGRAMKFSPAICVDAARSQATHDGTLAGADDLSDHPERLPFGQKASRVIDARRFNWSGHVFNLETPVGWYVTNGIVTHNCRCVPIPLVDLDRLNFGPREESEAA